MAIRAGRRELIAARDGFAVNAGVESVLDIGVALPAGGRNIELVDRRFGLVGGQDFMRAMAIGTDGGLQGALLDGTSVHAVLIGEERLRAYAVGLHEEALPVAAAARG